MRAITNSFLNRVRRLTQGVESINDAVKLIIERPELDQEIAAALKDSGYLDYWETERKEFPWRYDLTELVKFESSEQGLAESIRMYSERTIEDDKNGVFKHWVTNLQTIATLAQTHKRRSLDLLVELHKNLVDQHLARVAVARTWLQSHKN